MHYIRYKPRVNLGSLGVTRESIDYATAYAKITPTLVQPMQPPPVISVPISSPSSFYEPPVVTAPTSAGGISLTPPPGYIGTAVMPPPGTVWGYETSPYTGITQRTPVDPVTLEPYYSYERYVSEGGGFMPSDLFIPEPFVYSKDQIMDMLARGASETYERTGETDSGLPIAAELEQRSRELDATKNYIINADGAVIPVEPKPAGGGLALLAVAVAGFFLLGG